MREFKHIKFTISWEICKHEVKLASIHYSKSKARERHEKLVFLEEQLKILLIQNSNSQHDNSTIVELENEIKQIYDLKATGARIRSRLQFIEEGERNTKYFLGIEKSRQNKKTYYILAN